MTDNIDNSVSSHSYKFWRYIKFISDKINILYWSQIEINFNCRRIIENKKKDIHKYENNQHSTIENLKYKKKFKNTNNWNDEYM